MDSFTPKKRIYSDASATEKMTRMAEWLREHKASEVTTIDLSDKNAFTEAMVIATANSVRHAQSLADGINALCGENNYEYLSTDGYNVGQWILVDCNDIVVNIFQTETRTLYKLESLWTMPASKEELQSMAAETASAPAQEPAPEQEQQ